MKIIVRNPEIRDVDVIANNMRKSDVEEIKIANDVLPREALLHGINKSIYCRTVENGRPILMFGIYTENIIGDKATIWMLGTDDIEKIKLTFLRRNKEFVREMLEYYPYLDNYVHIKNAKSIKWLKALGATIEEPQPYGINGELFHHFYFEKGKV